MTSLPLRHLPQPRPVRSKPRQGRPSAENRQRALLTPLTELTTNGSSRGTGGFSLLEVVVAMAILLTGIVAIAAFFPMTLRQNQRAADVSTAAFIAQMIAEEIRKDDTRNRDLIEAIRNLAAPTDPVVFPLDSRFAYSFSGVSAVVPEDTPEDPRDDHGVARVIVRYAADFNPNEDVLYELRFDE